MNKRHQILFVYLFHAVLICIGFFILQARADAFFITVSILFGAYLIFYIVTNRKTYIPWILLLHHLIGSAVQFLLHFFEVLPSDYSWPLGGIGQFIYALFVVPGYFALLLLTHLVLFVIYKIRTKLNS